MTRTPLRPLARILDARKRGENPDQIERENIRLRHEEQRDRSRVRAEGRLLVLAVFFIAAFASVGLRMGSLSFSTPEEPQSARSGDSILAQRADIMDRNGRTLATNISTYSLYAQPPQMVDPAGAATQLAAIFPELDEAELLERFTGTRKFLWLKKILSPEQMQAVHDIGEPGLLFGPREMRLYPNGSLAAHVMGGASFGREGVQSAEVIGIAGVEKTFDDYLRDPANDGAPLQLSLDLTIQAATEEVLYDGMRLMDAEGAAAVLMEVDTGEIIALTSLPDFDPNDRPAPLTQGNAADSPLFNRAVQGVYELGSTFKIFAAAQAMDLGLVNPNTMIDTTGPIKWGRHTIRDFHDFDDQLSVHDIIVKSSNIGTARIAQSIGTARQQEFLTSLGFTAPTSVEMVEASGGRPLLPPNWSELSTMTISYGHGLSATPMHLASAYATIANGGRLVVPTLLPQEGPQMGPQIMREDTARYSLQMLREVVRSGTASFGNVEGYEVAGKTGTADKPLENGRGYYEDKVIATFASVFPASDPKYVLVVTLDEPEIYTLDEMRRTAGWTAVPVSAEIIRRVAPLLGLRPTIAPQPESGVTLTRN